MDESQRVQEAQKDLADLCKKYNVRIEPRITIFNSQLITELVIVADPVDDTSPVKRKEALHGDRVIS